MVQTEHKYIRVCRVHSCLCTTRHRRTPLSLPDTTAASRVVGVHHCYGRVRARSKRTSERVRSASFSTRFALRVEQPGRLNGMCLVGVSSHVAGQSVSAAREAYVDVLKTRKIWKHVLINRRRSLLRSRRAVPWSHEHAHTRQRGTDARPAVQRLPLLLSLDGAGPEAGGRAAVGAKPWRMRVPRDACFRARRIVM